jgi:hypothetical protein
VSLLNQVDLIGANLLRAQVRRRAPKVPREPGDVLDARSSPRVDACSACQRPAPMPRRPSQRPTIGIVWKPSRASRYAGVLSVRSDT